MLKPWIRVAAGLLAFGAFSTFGAASGADSSQSVSQRAEAIVLAAHAFVAQHSQDMEAVQKALMEDPRFRDDEMGLYIFMHAYDAEKKEAVCVGQGVRPELVGKHMEGLRTPNGRLVFYEMIELAEANDEFWLEYDWLNPYTHHIETKRSFFKKIILHDGRKAWVACGFWKG